MHIIYINFVELEFILPSLKIIGQLHLKKIILNVLPYMNMAAVLVM